MARLIPFLMYRALFRFFLLVAGLLLAFPLWGQHQIVLQKDFSIEELEITFSVRDNDNLRIGDVFTVCFEVVMKRPEWTMYSSQTEGELGYAPTALALDSVDSRGVVLVGKMEEDKTPEESLDDWTGSVRREFVDREVTFCQALKVTGGVVRVEGDFRLQICNPWMCQFLRVPYSSEFVVRSR